MTAGAHALARRKQLRLTFLGELRSEWIKFFSVRSTPWTLLTAVVVMVGLALLMASSLTFAVENPEVVGPGMPPPDQSQGLQAVTFGYFFGQFVMVVMGGLRVTSEYSSGQIRATFAAAPRRLGVFIAKAIVVTVTAFVVGIAGTALAYLATYPMLNPHGMAADLSLAATRESLLGVPLYLVMVALLAMGVGFLMRHTAAAVSVVIGVLLVLPIVGSINLDFISDIAPYFPSNAGARIINGEIDSETLSPWQGFAVMAGWVTITIAAAVTMLKRRDA